jgi:translation initiation factor IF-2
MRVYELAKALDVPSKELVQKLNEIGAPVKNHMSVLDQDVIERVKVAIKERAKAGGPAAVKPAAPVPPPADEPRAKPPRDAVQQEKLEAEKTKPVQVELPAPAAPSAPSRGGAASKRSPVAPHAQAVPPPVAPPAPLPPPVVEAAVPVPAEAKTITIRGPVVVKDLAEQLGLRPNHVISDLMAMNVLASINERLDPKVAQQVAEKHGFVVEREKRDAEHRPAVKKEENVFEDVEDRAEDLDLRAPIVTFLGHVDHGKTSLLDRIRKTQVVLGEDGGITQHIGAYTVEVGGRSITFLDTPGHQAFTAMRARGANLTDIAVIIVAADDGIMPQTEEAIKHAQAAEVPIMVAINKCDLPAANPDRVRQQLAAIGLTTEDWGGEVICTEVSATTGKGVDTLLELILLQSDMLELRSNPRRRARGFVIEAQLEPGMGPTAHLLVLTGTLNLGDALLVGPYWGRVRALINDHGIKVKSAGPAMPVKCMGLSGVPAAGAEFVVCPNDRMARSMAEQAAQDKKSQQLVMPRKASLESFYAMVQDAERLELRVIIKADVQGSVEAIEHSLREIKSDKVVLNIVMSGVGNVTTNDVLACQRVERGADAVPGGAGKRALTGWRREKGSRSGSTRSSTT